MIRKLEEISTNAWPSLQTFMYDGWILRFGNGVTRRANSIVPIYESTKEIEAKIEFCERLYADHKLPTIFKITSASTPANIDKVLEGRGYAIDAETSFQTLDLYADFVTDSCCEISIDSSYSDYWMQCYMDFNNHDKDKFNTYRSLLNQIRTKKGLLLLKHNGTTVGCGLGVLEGDFVGLFDIVVSPDERGKGFGKAVVESLLNWGKREGATTGYLQVMLNNIPAINLYDKIGFKEAYKYWYRKR
jgi:Acetyltransferases